MTTPDPWSRLGRGVREGTAAALRVDPEAPWNLFWARDADGRCMLVLRHRRESAPSVRLPRLRALEVKEVTGEPDGDALVLCLADVTLKDLFYRLCMDVVERIAEARSEQEAVAVAVARAWRWHYLLRGGGGGLLSERKQLGLIGELLVLESYFLALMPPAAAVAAWVGPLDAPQDFRHGNVAVEAKCRVIEDAGEALISSEHQLDLSGLTSLFLHVSRCRRPESTGEESFTVNEVADRIGRRLAAEDSMAAARFTGLLSAAGFDFADDYSASRWTGALHSVYRVTSAFPRLSAGDLPGGVHDVSYAVALAGTADFLVARDDVLTALGGE